MCMHIAHVDIRKTLLHSQLPCIQKIWRTALGEELECDREPDNSCHHYMATTTHPRSTVPVPI